MEIDTRPVPHARSAGTNAPTPPQWIWRRLGREMSDFTDDEDRQLVQLAAAFSGAGRQIPWEELTRLMVASPHSKDELRQRLKTLKRTHGRDLARFPNWFFRRPMVDAAASKAIATSVSKRQTSSGQLALSKALQSTTKRRSRSIKMSDLLNDDSPSIGPGDARQSPQEKLPRMCSLKEDSGSLLWVLASAAEIRTLTHQRQK